MDIEFTREENGTRYIYRLSPGDQGITGLNRPGFPGG